MGWTIAVDAAQGESRVVAGSTASPAPLELICESLTSVIGVSPDDVFVTVGKRRLGLARGLLHRGFSVTAGFRGATRADAAAPAAAVARRKAIQTEARSLGAGPERQRVTVPLPWTVPHDPVEWLPHVRRFAGTKVSAIRVAADASLDGGDDLRVFSLCIVSDRSDVLVDTGLTTETIGSLELEAIAVALELIATCGAEKAEILSDSMNALKHAWAAQDVLPPAQLPTTGLARASRKRFRTALENVPSRIDVEFRHVTSRGGDALHASADGIARVSRRAARIPQEAIERPLDARVDEIVSSLGTPPCASPESEAVLVP